MNKTSIQIFSLGFAALCLLMAVWPGCKGNVKPSSAPGTWDELTIKLERTACFGACPVYSLTIRGNGSVLYEGKDFVRTKGTREATISADAVNQLLLAFEQADFYALDDSYTRFGKSDMPSAYTSISIGTRTKSVRHYLGDNSAPDKLTELENKIDVVVNSAQWIK